MTRYYHWSRDPIDELKDLKYHQPGFKPMGFWFSVDRSWLDWCFSECFVGNSEKDHRYEIEFDESKIYKILTFSDLVRFNKEYPGSGDLVSFNKEYPGSGSFYDKINWEQVSQEYDGIVFYNYNDIMREVDRGKGNYKTYQWFYAISCNSGCIWNIPTITKFVYIKN